MMKLALSLGIFAMLLLAAVPQVQGGGTPEPRIKIVFDNLNASLRIYINESEYFNLTFEKVYITMNPYIGDDTDYGELNDFEDVNNIMMGSGKIGSMNMTEEKGWNSKMGNYTKVTMWKEITVKNQLNIPFIGRKETRVNLTVNFYIAEKNYTKDGIHVGRNTIRYSTSVRTETNNDFIILEERMSSLDLTTGVPGEVYEFVNGDAAVPYCWGKINTTNHVVKHRFGSRGMGMLKFSIRRANITYSWEYDDNLTTLYSYHEKRKHFHLFYAFKNYNGTVVQDPYITLPGPIMGNPNTIVEGVEDVVNYLMDHATSLAIGIVAAVVLVLSAPAARRFR